jgi:hypothetical protein
MHLIVPFASALSEGAKRTLHELKLPRLAKLLALLSPAEKLGIDEYTLTPPHERAIAQHLGWQGDDGCLPFAAQLAKKDGVDVGDRPWGLMTPVHWHVGTDHISLADPRVLHLRAHESAAFFEAIRPLFESEGWTLAWGASDRWYASHESLHNLPCASLDRAIGRNIDLWMPNHPQARLLRRLQNEVQMLLYQQPLNDQRVGLGALPVNSFWLSGCGRPQPERDVDSLTIDARLGPPLLAENPVAWTAAWHALDEGPIAQWLERAQQGQAVQLTLCGERFAQRFEAAERGWLARVARRFANASPLPVLEAL